jgi:hypothetical protein
VKRATEVFATARTDNPDFPIDERPKKKRAAEE